MAKGAAMRPNTAGSGERLYQSALDLVRRRVGADIAFGGPVTGGQLRLSQFHGARTERLFGLRVTPGLGLGGAVLETGRAGRVSDYEHANSITHDYDDPVLGEGIRGVLASPVVVCGRVRGVLYAGVRTEAVPAGKAGDALTDVARQLAGELRVEDEVDRRVAALAASPATDARELSAEVRGLAREVDDPALRQRLLRACSRVDGDDSEPAPVALSPRELDVLGEVALELTNAEIGERLQLRPETVKAYLRSVMRKLDVHSRHEAVVDARRHGMLP